MAASCDINQPCPAARACSPASPPPARSSPSPPRPRRPHAPCTPPGQLRSAEVARADRPDGSSEITEYVAGGEYRVTRCGAKGQLIVSQTVSPIADPDGGVALVPTETEVPGRSVSTLYGDPTEPSWSNEFRAARAALRAAVIPPTRPAATPPVVAAPSLPEAAAAASRAAAAAAAAAPRAAVRPRTPPSPPTPARTRSTRCGRASGPAAATATRSTAAASTTTTRRSASIVDGHRTWDLSRNSCGLNDITNLTSGYVGSTSGTIHSYPRRLLDHRQGRPGERRLRRRARLHVELHQRLGRHDGDRSALQPEHHVLERRRGGRV